MGAQVLLEDVGALGRRPLVQGGAYVVRVTGVHGYDLVARVEGPATL